MLIKSVFSIAYLCSASVSLLRKSSAIVHVKERYELEDEQSIFLVAVLAVNVFLTTDTFCCKKVVLFFRILAVLHKPTYNNVHSVALEMLNMLHIKPFYFV